MPRTTPRHLDFCATALQAAVNDSWNLSRNTGSMPERKQFLEIDFKSLSPNRSTSKTYTINFLLT